MKLTMLGTGHAMAKKCYNTCFVITNDENQHFLVDGGGGNQIFTQLENANIEWENINHIFLTHRHADHLIGLIWLIRMFCQKMRRGLYNKNVYIYAHEELTETLRSVSCMILQKRDVEMFDKQIFFVPVTDGESLEIIGKKVTFFDICSDKDKQFGFSMNINENEKISCCGDEPYQECEYQYVKDSKWLLHEAFCLYSQADIFQPYEKNHSTVKDACITAQRLNVENLILYHTEDRNIKERKKLYTEEGKSYFDGNLYVPEDLDVFEL